MDSALVQAVADAILEALVSVAGRLLDEIPNVVPESAREHIQEMLLKRYSDGRRRKKLERELREAIEAVLSEHPPPGDAGDALALIAEGLTGEDQAAAHGRAQIARAMLTMTGPEALPSEGADALGTRKYAERAYLGVFLWELRRQLTDVEGHAALIQAADHEAIQEWLRPVTAQTPETPAVEEKPAEPVDDHARGTLPPPDRAVRILDAFTAFTQASDLESSRRALEQHPELLSEEADAVIGMIIENAPPGTDRRVIEHLTRTQDVLRACREHGVEMVFSELASTGAAGFSDQVEPLLVGFTEFVQARNWSASRRVLEERPELLSEEADAVIEQIIRAAPPNTDERVIQNLKHHRDILRECRRDGIEDTFARLEAGAAMPEQAEAILGAFAAFAQATDAASSRRILEQHPTLLSEDADAVIGMLIENAPPGTDQQILDHLAGQRGILRECRMQGVEAIFGGEAQVAPTGPPQRTPPRGPSEAIALVIPPDAREGLSVGRLNAVLRQWTQAIADIVQTCIAGREPSNALNAFLDEHGEALGVAPILRRVLAGERLSGGGGEAAMIERLDPAGKLIVRTVLATLAKAEGTEG